MAKINPIPEDFQGSESELSDWQEGASNPSIEVTLPLESVSHSCAHAQASRGWLASQCSSNCTGLT